MLRLSIVKTKVKIGDTFGQLTITGQIQKGRKWFFECRCSCGGIAFVRSYDLTNEDRPTRSCVVCGRKRNKPIKHGATIGKIKSKEWSVWSDMKKRCSNPSEPNFRYYGARGIKVCERWQHSFANFLADMGPKPFATAQIDRKDNNGNYEPDNCRWATPREQVNNRRNTRFVTFNGITKPLSQWAIDTGIDYATLRARANQEMQNTPYFLAARVPRSFALAWERGRKKE